MLEINSICPLVLKYLEPMFDQVVCGTLPQAEGCHHAWLHWLSRLEPRWHRVSWRSHLQAASCLLSSQCWLSHQGPKSDQDVCGTLPQAGGCHHAWWHWLSLLEPRWHRVSWRNHLQGRGCLLFLQCWLFHLCVQFFVSSHPNALSCSQFNLWYSENHAIIHI